MKASKFTIFSDSPERGKELLCSTAVTVVLSCRWFAAGSAFPLSCIHTSTSLQKLGKWEKKNRIVYPPQLPGEPRRPAVSTPAHFFTRLCLAISKQIL